MKNPKRTHVSKKRIKQVPVTHASSIPPSSLQISNNLGMNNFRSGMKKYLQFHKTNSPDDLMGAVKDLKSALQLLDPLKHSTELVQIEQMLADLMPHYLKEELIERQSSIKKSGQVIADFNETAKKTESKKNKKETQISKEVNEMHEEIKGKIKSPEKINMTFNDIVGYDEIKQKLKGYAKMLKGDLKVPGGRSMQTLLMYGPPGNGKTALVRALAKEEGLKYINVKVSDIMQSLVGQSEKVVSALFSEVSKKENQPIIVFLDEIDSVASDRGRSSRGYERRVVTALLTELDGFESNKDSKVFVIAATNYPELLDDAIRSRFHEKIEIPNPPPDLRKSFFEKKLIDPKFMGSTRIKSKLSLDDLNSLVDASEGLSFREIENTTINYLLSVMFENIEKLTGNTQKNKKGADNRIPVSVSDLANELKNTRDRKRKILGYRLPNKPHLKRKK